MFGKPSFFTRKRLDENGVRASAEVLEIGKHGMTMESGTADHITSAEQLLKARLRVEPVGQPAFEIEKRFRFSQYDTPTVGQRISVVFDPDDHDTIELARFASTERGPGAFGSAPGTAGPGGGMDLGNLLASVQQAKAESGGDPQALAAALQASLGGQTPVVFARGGSVNPAPGAGEDPVEQLTKLADLRDRGVLSDEEFAAQKARILGEA